MHLAADPLTSSPPGRRLSSKGLLALIALLLAISVWVMGLLDSLSRDSVAPALSLQQQEKALLAQQVLAPQLRPLLAGDDPAVQLREALLGVPLERLDERQRLMLAALTTDPAQRQSALAVPFQSLRYGDLQRALRQHTPGQPLAASSDQLLQDSAFDPLLRRLSCEALGGTPDHCVDPADVAAASAASGQLLLAELLPIGALLLGGLLLLRHGWLAVRGQLPSLPPLQGPLLSPEDMAILVAGGFVLLGEVMAPVLVSPLLALLAQGQTGALRQAVDVLLGYVILALPPLVILRFQLQGLPAEARPVGGWLQWRLSPVLPALLQGVRGWLMVMPPVVLTGWLMTRIVGDQGGSNPLLEMVLRSDSTLALLLLALTAVVLAPLFEELVFRGVLLPVLARSLGSVWGVGLSALVFAVAHLSLGELPPLLVLGVGLALLRLRSGRLLPSVVMHACWNGATFINLILIGA